MKEAMSYLAKPLSKIINTSFTYDIFRDKLYIAKDCPILKLATLIFAWLLIGPGG